MIGFAVRTRCPSCKMVFERMAVTPPSASVVVERYCHGRRCRARGPVYFLIHDQRVEVLTKEDAKRMMVTTT